VAEEGLFLSPAHFYVEYKKTGGNAGFLFVLVIKAFPARVRSGFA
jgi:hypothetical protein